MGMVVTPLEFHGKPVKLLACRMKFIIACFQVDPDQYIEHRGKCNNQSRHIQQMIKQVLPETAEGIPED